VTELLLKKGANPNTRSIWEQGLRMHPLSWNVYGGHVDNVRLLLENGADANLDFDSMTGDKIPVTAMDIALQLRKVEEGDDRFAKLDALLRNFGAMTIEELQDKKNEEELQDQKNNEL
jgi:ankyrin repeat protein